MHFAPTIQLAIQHSLAAKEAPTPRLRAKHYRAKAQFLAKAIREDVGGASVCDRSMINRGIIGIRVQGHALHIPIRDLPSDLQRWVRGSLAAVAT